MSMRASTFSARCSRQPSRPISCSPPILLLASNRQNEVTRQLAGWAAILAVPTAVAGIYGMNFEHMPELKEVWGYPAVLLLIGAVCLGLFFKFRRMGWI